MKHFIYSFIFILCGVTSQAQPGTLDKNFGMNGIVITRGNSYDYCHEVILQSDGKIIQAGEGNCTIGYGFLLRRFNPDGSLDGSFGNSGCVTTQISEYSTINAVAVQTDGKIIAGGFLIDEYNLVDIALTRYKPDGSLDSSFGENGIIVEERATDDYLTALAIQPDGKIIVTGNASYPEGFVFRYMPDGSPDESFGDNGKVFTIFDRSKQINALLLMPDEKIVLGGLYDKFSSKPKFMLVKYLSDGSLDMGFGEGGVLKTSFNDGYHAINLYALSLQQDSKIIAAGSAAPDGVGYNNSMALMRFQSNGSLDNLFGKDGKLITDFGTYYSEAKSALIQPDGKILAAGRYSDNNSFSHFAIARYQVNGNIDSSFGNNGLEVTNLGILVGCEGAVLQADGKIILAGDNSSSFILARYNGGDAVLATTYKHFKAEQNAQSILLNWQTLQETNNTYFAVERSSTSGNTSYSEIGRVKSKGNSSLPQQYSFTDKFPLSGENYYRLKQFEADGNYNYSAILQVSYTGTASIKIFPNPADNILNIEGLKASEENMVSLFDMQGRLLKKFTVQSAAHSLQTGWLAAGTYLLRIQNSSGTGTYKFVKK